MTDDSDTDRVLDVREIDGEPFGDIMQELDALERSETFLLINSFEPAPLYNVLERRGFTYETTEEKGTWEVRIEHA